MCVCVGCLVVALHCVLAANCHGGQSSLSFVWLPHRLPLCQNEEKIFLVISATINSFIRD